MHHVRLTYLCSLVAGILVSQVLTALTALNSNCVFLILWENWKNWTITLGLGSWITAGCLPAKLLQSCPTLCNPMDCSPPGSSVQGILQARILEWVAMPFSKDHCLWTTSTWRGKVICWFSECWTHLRVFAISPKSLPLRSRLSWSLSSTLKRFQKDYLFIFVVFSGRMLIRYKLLIVFKTANVLFKSFLLFLY